MSGEARLLSEPDAWREIAERIAGSGGFYLCHAIDRARIAERISEETSDRMRKRIADHGISTGSTLWTVAYEDGDDAWSPAIARDLRVTAALFLALDAEDDDSEPDPGVSS